MRWLAEHQLGVAVGCVWAMAVALVGALALGWTTPVVQGLAGLLALGATWLVLGVIAPARRELADRAITAADRLVTRVGAEPAAGLVENLEAVGRRLDSRLAGLEAETKGLEAVLAALESALVATNLDGEVTLANPSAEAFFGRGRLIGMSIEDLFTRAEVLSLHAAALKGSSGRVQIRVPGPAQIRTYQVIALPVPESGAVLVMRDITELATAVQLKTDFVANASHEFRTPIAAVRAAVETLRDSARDDPEMSDRLLTMIASNIDRLEDLTRDLLDLSRLESPDVPVQSVAVRGSELAEALQGLFDAVCNERRLELRMDFEPVLDEMKSDPRLLMLILRNLVDNATKFAFEETTVSVRGEPTEDRGVRFEVEDHGIGIPLDQQARVFERFYQVDLSRSGLAQRRGTGLGLAIVKHAVKALGGSISLRSVWQQGTTITVEVPGVLKS